MHPQEVCIGWGHKLSYMRAHRGRKGAGMMQAMATYEEAAAVAAMADGLLAVLERLHPFRRLEHNAFHASSAVSSIRSSTTGMTTAKICMQWKCN